MGDKPEKRGGIDVEMGRWGGRLFFISLQFNSVTFTVCVFVCVGEGSKVPFIPFGSSVLASHESELAMQDSHPSL